MKEAIRILSLFILTIVLFAFVSDEKKTPVIYMIGDSTMANKNLEKGNPERGWGHVLPGFLDKSIKVENHAVNGRSSKSFRAEGRWDKVIDKVKECDYVFIQFGHNDQKANDSARYTNPEGEFKDNLKRYIFETRAKGGIPVLFTSIPRRNFLNDTLIDTHEKWLEATKEVARETGVTLIDMNKSVAELLEKTGDVKSREWFMWIKPGTNVLKPDGLEDNTHLNVAGARIVAKLAVKEMEQKLPDLAPYFRYYDFVVAKDGSGDFFSIQDAIDAVPMFRNNTTKIYIRNGVYDERLLLPADKNKVMLIGEDVNKTLIVSDDYAQKQNRFGENYGTSGSAGFYIYANDFTAENITFENKAGQVGQAVAVLTMGDRVAFYNCRFLGNQDTLYVKGEHTRVYFANCYIEGTTDFIFGWATAVFNNCVICSKSNSFITAASTPENVDYGYLFYKCKLIADKGVTDVYLGRPWRPYAKVAYVECEMGNHINPLGWHNWNKKEAEKTTEYVEINNFGEGAKTSKRVKWMKKSVEGKSYTMETYLKGTDDWKPFETNGL
ncbi:MAG: GDSL-type esterase/lipase family protein [Culturomica sp.]|jgi:pectinesterase|nr:GDSL-type esterase/lipase family protein [Culturomica sp.]